MTGTLMPNHVAARVADSKVRDFILNDAHPDNKGRARFFAAFGFTAGRWDLLKDALVRHPRRNVVVRASETGFGTRYRVHCDIVSPDERNPCIVTVWTVDRGSAIPMLVTAFPGPNPTKPGATPAPGGPAARRTARVHRR